MEWLGLHFFIDLPGNGHLLLNCSHNPFLVLLAYLVACAAGFGTLDMAERVSHVEDPTARRHWRWLGAGCLAGGIWSTHYISMLAFQAPIAIHYELIMTFASLVIALIASLFAMQTLSHAQLRLHQYLLASVWMGLGIALMHYVGMSAMDSEAKLYFKPGLFMASVGIAIAASLAALLLSICLRNGMGTFHQLLKYAASLMLGTGILSMHFTGMAAMQMLVPAGADLSLPLDNNPIQLGLSVAVITLLVIGSSISAALADKKLQHKERDLRRVNALLDELDQARASLQQVAHYDALTSLLNRRGFNQIFAEKLAEKTAHDGMLAVIFLDIDHFKRINDSLGHDAGDQLLSVLAGHIKSSVRSHADVVARFGGDEFCILINIHHRDEAQHLAQRIMQKMKEPVELAGRRMVMTTSIGISLFPDDGLTCEELLKTADLALYQSKDSGRNSLNFFSSNLKTRAFLELQLEEQLRAALRARNELVLFYQPIFDMKRGKVTRLEALVRWQHPQHGLLTPERFIGIAESNGLIAELDHWVMRQACHDLSLLSDKGYTELTMAVNCSALNLTRDELADEIEDALRFSGIAANRLELEVTENALMGNISSTLALLRQIRALGVSLAIDDFGTGYSSLAYLKRLPLNTLKIDRSFIQDIPKSNADIEIVQAIIGMAHTLHLQVVTEGVETQAQFELLLKHGCDFIQGYLLSPAVPARDIIGVIQGIHRRTPLSPFSVAGAKDTPSPKDPATARTGSTSVIRPIR
ncbi:EAL domain-containing protein [Pseudomonas fluorescens]|uniref:cyclic-guanylate-specific phosphodiesterase n=1 Tax=Pseudomonas fluorescens TaxID=294 RepID=A0A7M2JC36_PSEFL|nr:EAL domain-containing protein [Pseudomonas fluorescens]QOU06663.1 EAL domain-containing protein [Pseudomonas fluorescens]